MSVAKLRPWGLIRAKFTLRNIPDPIETGIRDKTSQEKSMIYSKSRLSMNQFNPRPSRAASISEAVVSSTKAGAGWVADITIPRHGKVSKVRRPLTALEEVVHDAPFVACKDQPISPIQCPIHSDRLPTHLASSQTAPHKQGRTPSSGSTRRDRRLRCRRS